VLTTFREKVMAYVGFDDSSTAALREAKALVAPHFGAIIDDFYDTIEAHPDARAAITGGASQIARLKQSLLRWIDDLFTGPHDEAYFERRLRIGRVHVRIDLPQMYMLTAMDRIRVQTMAVMRGAGLDEGGLRRMLTAIHQILDIELAIMLESYRDDLVTKNRTAERLATIGQFAAGIGHELRNPLGVVESSAFLVSRRLEQLKISDPGLTRHMEKIVTEVQRSGRTINDLLELARNRPPKRRRVDARDVVLQAVPAAHLPAGVTIDVMSDRWELREAEALFRRALQLRSNFPEARLRYGRVLDLLGKHA